MIALFIVIPTKLLTANMKYLRVCLKRMSAQQVRVDKSSYWAVKLSSIYDFNCVKCLNRPNSAKIFLLYIQLAIIGNLLEPDYSTT